MRHLKNFRAKNVGHFELWSASLYLGLRRFIYMSAILKSGLRRFACIATNASSFRLLPLACHWLREKGADFHSCTTSWDQMFQIRSKSIIDFYLNKYSITSSTVVIDDQGHFIAFNSDEQQHKSAKNFEKRFSSWKEIGQGGFGKVYSVLDNYTQSSFAVKKIQTEGKYQYLCKIMMIYSLKTIKTFLFMFFYPDLDEDELMREVNTISQCSGDFVVHYYDWIKTYDCLYIQMDLCSDNLKNIIKQKTKFFGRKESEPMEAIEYFISCQIFKELLECLQYLHESKPPVIHRDIKPENFLVLNSPSNERFIRLCDFGLAVFDEAITGSHTRNQGTLDYMAPEVKRTRKYNRKADVYSLGLIAQELFGFSIF